MIIENNYPVYQRVFYENCIEGTGRIRAAAISGSFRLIWDYIYRTYLSSGPPVFGLIVHVFPSGVRRAS
jgi:hypothetical protein